MKTHIKNIPDNVEIDTREAAMLLAARRYEQGKLFLGQAAESAGYSKRTFMKLLGNHNVSLFNYNEEELENVSRNAGHYHL